jgi:hypothetical protein
MIGKTCAIFFSVTIAICVVRAQLSFQGAETNQNRQPTKHVSDKGRYIENYKVAYQQSIKEIIRL